MTLFEEIEKNRPKKYKALLYTYDNGAWKLSSIINEISILEAWRLWKKGIIQANQIRFNDNESKYDFGCLCINRINGVEKIKLLYHTHSSFSQACKICKR